MLILLPPSEGKTVPETGAPLDLAALSAPTLTATRERILKALVAVSAGNQKRAMDRLGLGPTQADDLTRNAGLLDAPTARADAIYTGVLYSAWDPASQDAIAQGRADATVAIASALFGVVRPGDQIPAYRLSGTVTLPRLGTVAGQWRPKLGPVFDDLTDEGLLVDLRSGTYVNLHKPTGDLATRTATVRVLHEHNGTRKVVSHFNKATKGHLVRALVASGQEPRSIDALADLIGDLGWRVERHDQRLDLVIDEVPTH